MEDLVHLKIFVHDTDFVDKAVIGELARRSVGKHSNDVRHLGYNVHICYVFNNSVFFKAYCCPTCHTFFNRAPNLELHLTTCKKRVKLVYPKNVYQLNESLFGQLDSFGIFYTGNQTFFENMAVIDFKSIRLEDEDFKDTERTTWIGNHIPISVSISSKSIKEPVFFCNSSPRDLLSSYLLSLML